MAPRKDKEEPKSLEEMQRELAEVQLESAHIGLDQARASAQQYRENQEAISRRNKQRQSQLATEVATEAALIAACNHKQGGSPDNMLEGDGKSALNRAHIFFGGNIVVFCLRCPLRVAKPHPGLKKVNREKYKRDLEYWESLVKESKKNGLSPMIGPQYEFTNEDGIPIIPELR